MKFKIFILLILTIVLVQNFAKASVKNLGKEKSHFKTSLVKLKVTNGLAGAGNSTNSSEPIFLNSVGRRIYISNVSDIILTKFPVHISRCDQIVTFNGSFIPNLREYRGRANATFVLTAHYAHMKKLGTEQLLRSILLSETKIMPHKLRGSGNCLIIFSKQGGDFSIPICLENRQQVENILTVLKNFSDCRGGIQIGNEAGKLDKLKIAQMIRGCSGKGKFVDPKELAEKLKKARKDLLAKGLYKDTNYFHPGSDNVPGTGWRRR